MRGKGSEPNFMSGVNNEQEREPRRGGGRPQRQRGGYSFTPLGRSHQGGGGGGGSHDDFPGVEFSIAGGVEEMVHGFNYCHRVFFILTLHLNNPNPGDSSCSHAIL